MTRDAYAGRICRPSSLNGFAYAQGRPSRFVDPLGFDPSDPCQQLLNKIEQLDLCLYRKWADYLVGPKPPLIGNAAGNYKNFEGLRRGLDRRVAGYLAKGCDSSKLPSDLSRSLTLPNP
ncbi:MAG: hypothetical protein ACREXY_17160 [Gammaproteobacteria bacterium]